MINNKKHTDVKKYFLSIFVTLAMVVSLSAQAPIKFNFQTVVRDVHGSLVSNHLVHVKTTIIVAEPDGKEVYSEHSSAMTDRSGWVTIVVGEGVALSGDINTIDWGQGPYYMRCDIDPAGGNNYTVNTVQQLVSVPYALYAGGGDYNKLSNLPDLRAMIREVVQQEASNLYKETQGMADVASVSNSAGNSQIKDILDPTDPQDAVTLAFLQNYVDNRMRSAYDSSMRSVDDIMRRNGSVKINEKYERPVTITTPVAKNGVLPGLFSVGPSRQVRFSQGNLQRSDIGKHSIVGNETKPGTWRFAQSQYSEKSDDGLPWETYFKWGETGCELEDGITASICNDWGLYNAISNGGNVPGQWRLLSIEEWNYLRSERKDARLKFGLATVEGQAGVVLLPDDWTKPASVTFQHGSLRGFTTNNYDYYQWSLLEAAGAVFLPAMGGRIDNVISNVGSYGAYWSASVKSGGSIYSLDFFSSGLQTTGNHANVGQSVRLVQDK